MKGAIAGIHIHLGISPFDEDGKMMEGGIYGNTAITANELLASKKYYLKIIEDEMKWLIQDVKPNLKKFLKKIGFKGRSKGTQRR